MQITVTPRLKLSYKQADGKSQLVETTVKTIGERIVRLSVGGASEFKVQVYMRHAATKDAVEDSEE